VALRFRHLQTRILVFFLGLLLVVQGLTFLAVTTANSRSVNEQIENDLRVTGRVFHRFVEDRVGQLILSATLLSGDFAFKQAYAGGDRDTLYSAVRNLQEHRIGADIMMLADAEDYSVIVDTLHPQREPDKIGFPDLIEAAEDSGKPTTSLTSVDGRLYRLVVVPLLAPEPVAWIVVGLLIDDEFAHEIKELTLTKISFVTREPRGGFSVVSTTLPSASRDALPGELDKLGNAPGEIEPITVLGEQYVVLTAPQGKNVTVVLQRSLDDALTPFRRLYRVLAALTALSLGLSIVGVVIIARTITLPIRKLARSTRRIETGDYRHQIAITQKDEIGQLADAFNRMTRGLAAFQRYVPTELVRTLIARGIESKPQARVATILFTDIEGFTSIGEELSPDRLVKLLNEYFSVITKPIENHKGVITQFQGDAVLAVFNVPTDDPDHAANAVRAALEIQELLADRVFSEGIKLTTRVGINTGNVVAGSVGSEDRVNYTVHGDAVNLTARLEALNKDYGTRIILSKSTADLVRDRFPCERIGEIAVRGKQESVMVYRLASCTDRTPAV
jgi:adenylate cyclase